MLESELGDSGACAAWSNHSRPGPGADVMSADAMSADADASELDQLVSAPAERAHDDTHEREHAERERSPVDN